MTATILLLLGALLTLALSAFFSGTETGTYCLNRVRLRVRADRGDPAARRLADLMRRQEELVIANLFGTSAVDYLFTVCITTLLLNLAFAAHQVEFYATLIVTPLMLVFGALVPKEWFRRESDRLMYPLALSLAACVKLARLTGLPWLLQKLTRALVRRIDPARAAQEEGLFSRGHMLRLLQEGATRGGLTVFQRDLIDRVLNVSQVRVGSVMIPRARIAAVPVDLPREDFLRIARMAHFSRLPVYEGDPARIIGIINVYDVLTDEERKSIAAHVREALFLQPDESVPRVLLKLQQNRQAMAIVRDRNEKCVGILTIKDLVEEIVGDLEAW